MKKLSIKKLFREARFPDEKFWKKDGTPIYAAAKGPPPGTVGKTHADLGAGPPEMTWDDAKKDHPDIYQDIGAFGDDESTCDCGHTGSGSYPEECPECSPWSSEENK